MPVSSSIRELKVDSACDKMHECADAAAVSVLALPSTESLLMAAVALSLCERHNCAPGAGEVCGGGGCCWGSRPPPGGTINNALCMSGHSSVIQPSFILVAAPHSKSIVLYRLHHESSCDHQVLHRL